MHADCRCSHAITTNATPSLVQHFAIGQQVGVGRAQPGSRHAKAAHEGQPEAGILNELGAEAIMGAGALSQHGQGFLSSPQWSCGQQGMQHGPVDGAHQQNARGLKQLPEPCCAWI